MEDVQVEWLTIVETLTFIKRATKILAQEELDDLKQALATMPELGVLQKLTKQLRQFYGG